MICLLHYLFHLLENFTKTYQSLYELKKSGGKTQWTAPFLMDLPFFLDCCNIDEYVIKHYAEIKTIPNKVDCIPHTFFL